MDHLFSSLRGHPSNPSPMHLFLFCPDGSIRTLWLPKTMEGRYRFDSEAGKDDLPFHIEANKGQWIFSCEKTAYLSDVDQTIRPGQARENRVMLCHMLFKYIRYKSSTFLLYAEIGGEAASTFVPYRFDTTKKVFSIGRNPDNAIIYNNPAVSRQHAILRRNETSWTIIDTGSKNGVYVNGKDVTEQELQLGDVIFIMGLYMIIGSGYISINNQNDRVIFNTPYIQPIERWQEHAYMFAVPDKAAALETLFDRPPRKMIKIDPEPIDIELPPMKMGGNRIPLLLRLGNPVLMGSQSLLMGNYLAAVTSMVMPSLMQGMSEKDRHDYEVKRQNRYSEYLEEKAKELEKERIKEQRLLNLWQPPLSDVLRFAFLKDRLWERRKTDDDFLSVRIGVGQRPLLAERQYEKKRFDLDDDELVDRMYALAEKPIELAKVPITISFTEDNIVGVIGSTGLIGDFVRNLILQIAMTHSYDEVKLCVLADETYASKLDFVRFLPHAWDAERKVRFYAESKADLHPIASYLKSKEEAYLETNTQTANRMLKKEPAFVFFALDKTMFESLEVLKSVLDDESYRGITIIAAFDGIPKECSKIIDVGSSMRLIDLKHSDKDDVVFSTDQYDQSFADLAVNELFHTKLKTNAESFALPSMVTFLEMYHAGKVEFLNPLVRWKENNPIKSLSAPVGVGTDGSLFTLDLHEKKQGPHGLIAGMTGSGKSEFIITYILSMAVNYSPEEVAFILIDYKGGGLADAFENEEKGIHLPHLVGTITNLDGSAIQRSLMSINSELKRRQTEFKRAKSKTNEGTLDIYDYQKLYRNHQVDTPMPHLFIISDEFAELKKQQPEFMDELISTARIGRSLGVHLILATQKPGGVVNDQIWSNTRFRVSLRVQDRSDSMEMLKRPEAAELKQTGRFYMQVGYNEFFALGQSAWCGAEYIPQEEVVAQEDDSIEFIDNAGQVFLRAKQKKERKKAASKQIVAIVKYLSDLAKREGITAKKLWEDPLPMHLDYSTLPAIDTDTAQTIRAMIGKVDDPENQCQFPFVLDLQSFHHALLCGSSGSGKSTLIRTLLYSLVRAYSPEDINYYLVDLSAGALNLYRNMPHCGAYLTEENESDFDRLLKLIKEIVAERKALFAEADVFSFDAYRKTASLPLILVVIDGWTNIAAFQKGQQYNLGINEYMREASNYGIRFILTINNINEISAKAKQEMDYRLVLRAKDKFDYNDILNIRGATVPPEGAGRGVCVIDGRPLEYQVAAPHCLESDQQQNALLKQELRQLAERYGESPCVKKLSMMQDDLTYMAFCKDFGTDRIPLGYNMENMRKTAIPLQQLHTMGLFFGNPLGIKPVVSNLMYAFNREGAQVIALRRQSDTIFTRSVEEELRQRFGDRFSLLDTTRDGLRALSDQIILNLDKQVPFRNEFCQEKGIPATDRKRTKKAAKYIREHSTPLFVLFESFSDICRTDLDDRTKAEFESFFGQLMGYNVYFFAGFYPEDESRSTDALFKSFMAEDLALIFGGQFHTAWLTRLPSTFKSMEKVNPNYNRFVLKYHGDSYRMIMPCGELLTASADPDEADIV